MKGLTLNCMDKKKEAVSLAMLLSKSVQIIKSFENLNVLDPYTCTDWAFSWLISGVYECEDLNCFGAHDGSVQEHKLKLFVCIFIRLVDMHRLDKSISTQIVVFQTQIITQMATCA